MWLKNGFLVSALLLIAVFLSSCGGGMKGPSGSATGKLVIENNCESAYWNTFVNDTSWGTISPGENTYGYVDPTIRYVKVCVANTSNCTTKGVAVIQDTEYIIALCTAVNQNTDYTITLVQE